MTKQQTIDEAPDAPVDTPDIGTVEAEPAPTVEADDEVVEGEIIGAQEPGSEVALVDAPLPARGMPAQWEWNQMLEMSSHFADSMLVPAAYRRKPADCLLAMMMGHDLGITATMAFQKVYIVDGKPSMSAELMVALVRRAGYSITPVESNSERAAARGRRGDEDFTVVWTIEDAQRANLTSKDNWQHYPTAMLWARAVAQLCRIMFPDVLCGISYVPDEIGGIVDENGQLIGNSLPPSERDASPAISDEKRAEFQTRIDALSDQGRAGLKDEWTQLQVQGDLAPLTKARECDAHGIDRLLVRWTARDDSQNPKPPPTKVEADSPKIQEAKRVADEAAARQNARTASAREGGSIDDVPDAEIVEDEAPTDMSPNIDTREWEALGYMDAIAMDDAVQAFIARAEAELTSDEREALKTWRKDGGIEWPPSAVQLATLNIHLDGLATV